MEKARTFVTELLKWAKRTSFRDFAYRHETDPFRKLSLAVLLQRARPPQVDKANKRLFLNLPTIHDIANASIKQIAELIRPSGMHQIKAERVQKLAKILLNQYDGKVPQNRKDLLRLPGIGEYAADVVLAWAFDQDVTMIDTNVYRILKRVGFIEQEREARAVLEGLIPRGYRKRFNLILIEFGGLVCKPIKPHCHNCILRNLCRYAKSHFRVKLP